MAMTVFREREYKNGNMRVWARCGVCKTSASAYRFRIEDRDEVVALLTGSCGCTRRRLREVQP